MALFFGYDPGGYGAKDESRAEPANGVIAVGIDECGRFDIKEKDTVRDASEAVAWFRERPFAIALGIDTLLAWSFRGHRSCDDRLRTFYKEHVHQQNSLQSSMTVNGILVATRVRQEFGVPLVESHPKLLLRARSRKEEPLVPPRVLQQHRKLKQAEAAERQHEGTGEHDHQADAFIAAWCASRWYFRDPDWHTDLYGVDREDPLYFPAGPAVYPWPERIASNDG